MIIQYVAIKLRVLTYLSVATCNIVISYAYFIYEMIMALALFLFLFLYSILL